ncbi:hypothetical protein ASD14_05695 [Lysobacter sp. Root494]|nr:hypothetical protein ASD14_05695 [Lysobacter sp. Root494]
MVSAQQLSNAVNSPKQNTAALADTTADLTQAAAALLPVSVSASGNHAEMQVGEPILPLLEVSLDFQDATGLSPSSLGASARLVNPGDAGLLARLADLNLTPLTDTLNILVTIEPPANGGLSFRGTGRLEIHTHLLPYTQGSSLRVFKAPLLGPFRDVTDEIAQGSVRARTTYGGFSQFLILVDLRPTRMVVDEKIGWLRNHVAALPVSERAPLDTLLDQADAAVDAADYPAAIAAVDAFRARVQARAGQYIANEWRATHDVENDAGQLIAGASTLRFSVAYLRDYGQ